jgi:hypothetical protein
MITAGLCGFSAAWAPGYTGLLLLGSPAKVPATSRTGERRDRRTAVVPADPAHGTLAPVDALFILDGDRPVPTELVLGVAATEAVGAAPSPWDLPAEAPELVEPTSPTDGNLLADHRDAIEDRIAQAGFDQAGPAVDRARLKVPLVAGEETSGLCRVLAAAHFRSGISAVYPHDGDVGMINAHLEVALHRAPSGEWVRLDATALVDPSGMGLCTTVPGDRGGPTGVAAQSLVALTTARSR